MKGVYIQQQLEFRLNVEGEEFRQGDTLECKLTVKNHGTETQYLNNLTICLALGDLKKVKQKVQGAFSVLASADLPTAVELAGNAEIDFSWQVALDKNAVVSDKAQSLFFLFGNSSNQDVLGQLPLALEPHSDIAEILKIFESSFQFMVKSRKMSKEWLAIKIQPSSAAKYTLIDLLTLSVRFEGENLALKYVFDMKKFEATASSLGVGKTKNTVNQLLEPAVYKKDGFFQHAVIEEKIQQALSEVL